MWIKKKHKLFEIILTHEKRGKDGRITTYTPIGKNLVKLHKKCTKGYH